ncbi:M16 family metallopeptidase [Deinococcus maricopensis]|uniref:Processing peptidase n=1 Tax=Deinococcus maricopensis (strain DSM 21211 / LMG 22137 / NRRL B-23946 / LB-34) TaxID=709986 RepID=E8U3J8_DEIML|nr:pitrilysin family protein [Deinococcus maricopensis]ADV68622.1 processing peptidase [Deinococcus maricopensis DSM 21211]
MTRTGLKFLTATLPNGLTVLGEPDVDAQTIAMGYFVKTGARDEDPRDLGASHFLEHMLFKGSAHVSAAELNARLDALGGNVNAFTSEEATVYHAAALPERAPDLLAALTELMTPAMRESDLEPERGVILEEIAMYADQPGVRVFEALRDAYWRTAAGEAHPLGHNVLGTNETVGRLNAETLRAHFQARYGTGRVTLVVVGKFDWNDLLAQTEALTRAWPRTSFERTLGGHAPRPGLLTLQDDTLNRAHFAVCTPGLAANDPAREAALVLADIVGGENGRLYWALVDSGLADSADLSHTEFEETGAFEGGWSCDPDRAAETLAIFRSVLADVREHGVTEAEVRRARKRLAVSTLLRGETPSNRLFALGMDHLYLGRAFTLAESVARCEAVTPADVQGVLNRDPFGTVFVAALGPAETVRQLQLPA